jgi:hypothetical protein
MRLYMNQIIDGKNRRFRRSFSRRRWIFRFNDTFVVHFLKPDTPRDKWTAWLRLGQEPIALGNTLRDVFRQAELRFLSTLRDGDPEMRERKYQPTTVYQFSDF